MFGQDDNSNNQNNDLGITGAPTDNSGAFLVGQPTLDASTTQAPQGPSFVPGPSPPPVPPPMTADQSKDLISPAGGYPSSPNNRIAADGSSVFPEPTFNMSSNPSPDPAQTSSVADLPDQVNTEELIGIKKKALSELIPLIDSLDLPPLEKFRTIMMMIQASDDERLIEKAYESAHSIDDNHAKAQALLDLVNEINYFTQTDKDITPEPAPAPANTSPLDI